MTSNFLSLSINFEKILLRLKCSWFDIYFLLEAQLFSNYIDVTDSLPERSVISTISPLFVDRFDRSL